jgi:hypothetical protein
MVMVALGEPGTPLISWVLALADNRRPSITVAMPDWKFFMVILPTKYAAQYRARIGHALLEPLI